MLVDGPLLITGATGYVGRHLVARLRAEHPDQPLRALVRPRPDGSSADLPEGVETAEGDLTHEESLRRAVVGARAIVHLAAITADAKRPKEGYGVVNALGPKLLARAAAHEGVGLFVHMGGIDHGEDVGEYLEGRRDGERAVRASGVPWILLQPSVQFGDGSAFIAALARLVRLAPVVPVPGDGTFAFTPVWVEDVVTCVLASLGDPARIGHRYELGGPDVLAYDEVLRVIGEGYHKKRVRLVHLPFGFMKVQATLLQALPSPPLTPATMELFDAVDNAAAPGAIEREFGFAPRSMREHFLTHGVG